LQNVLRTKEAAWPGLAFLTQGGVAEIARKAKLTREATYKMLSKSGNPESRSLTAVLEATGLRIAVKPIEKQAA